MSGERENELLHLLALSMASAVGPVTARKLLETYGSAGEVFRQSRADLQGIRGLGPVLSSAILDPGLPGKAEKEYEFLQRHRIRILPHDDPGYPAELGECEDAPILLFVKGSEGFGKTRRLSVVGTRKATSYGKEMCRTLIRDLAAGFPDLVIVSGLAYGIDVMAHRAALDNGLSTLAVLGHGFATLYPHSHRETARAILTQGALVSDFPSGMPPERNNFLRRNRIIAGLSQATLVVESAAAGGALITAHLAFHYNREVLAVPGRTDDKRSRGCNALIREHKAHLVETAADIARQLNWDLPRKPEPGMETDIPLPDDSRAIFDLIRDTPGIGIEEIASNPALPVPNILSSVLQMELHGWIRSDPGQRFHCRIDGEGCPEGMFSGSV
ncbi:MAG: DNA-processing protein DprA [Bacteroidales bacterium]